MNTIPIQTDVAPTPIHHSWPVLPVLNLLVAGAALALAVAAIATDDAGVDHTAALAARHGRGCRGSRSVVGRSGAASREPGRAAVRCRHDRGASRCVVGRLGGTSREPGRAAVRCRHARRDSRSLVGGAPLSER